MTTSDEELDSLLQQYLAEYTVFEPTRANSIQGKLNEWRELNKPNELLLWWSTQEQLYLFDLQSYAFWLWTEKGINYDLFETVYYTLTPVTKRERTVPVIITTGLDDSRIEGGFRIREFEILDYQFIPTERGFDAKYLEPQLSSVSLDTVLDFFSFVIEKHSFRAIGFRQLFEQTIRSSATAAYEVTLMPEIENTSLDYDFGNFEGPLKRISTQPKTAMPSIARLLHIRHRAIVNTDWESKLIALWASIELIWGTEESEDKFLTSEEQEAIEKALSELSLPDDRRKKVLGHIKILKKRTKNDRIIEGIEKLSCAQGQDISKRIRDTHSLRSKCVHGSLLSSDELQRAQEHIRFMMLAINELITESFSKIGIRLA